MSAVLFLGLSSAESPSPTPSLFATLKAIALIKALQVRIRTRKQFTPSNPRYLKSRTRLARSSTDQQWNNKNLEDMLEEELGLKGFSFDTRQRKAALPQISRADYGDAIFADDRHQDIIWDLCLKDAGPSGDTVNDLTSDFRFLKREEDFHLKQIPVRDTISWCQAIWEKLDDWGRSTDESFAFSTEIDTHWANLEHLLHCLYHVLLTHLASQLIDLFQQHMIDCQKDQNLHNPDWFAEFPDAQHPVSTTWPWRIRPSMAVIWGVYWMFLAFSWDSQDNMLDDDRSVLATPAQVQEFMSMGTEEIQSSCTQAPLTFVVPRQACILHNTISPAASRLNFASGQHTPPSIHYPTRYKKAPSGTCPGAAPQYCVRHPPLPPGREVVESQHHKTRIIQEDGSGSSRHYYIDVAFPSTLDDSYFEDALPARASSFQRGYNKAPYPGRNLGSLSSNMDPQPIQNMPSQDENVNPDLNTLSQALLHHAQESHDQVMLDHEQINNHQDSRKRSFSEVSQLEQQRDRSVGSEGSRTSLMGTSPKDFSHTKNVVNRGDPPMNEAHKYYCDFSAECKEITFDRKCEWTKHMDKHQRPYQCPHPSCAKLQGFTYSGGLLRHEREVHNKHGGPKAQLMCPYPSCKRHSGKGFTRKENLNEHVRRVHAKPSQDDNIAPRELLDVSQVANESQYRQDFTSPGGHVSSPVPSEKRRRLNMESEAEQATTVELEALHDRVTRLTEESLEKDRRLLDHEAEYRRLQEAEASYRQRIDDLESQLAQARQRSVGIDELSMSKKE